MQKKSNTAQKKRNWAFIVYPSEKQLAELGSLYDGADGFGSVPDDWREQLALSGLMYAISPLHDKDTLDDNSGRYKKPHYHVIVVYGSPTTFANVKRLTDSLNSPIPQPLEQVRGYYRYFTHKDNPDKFQYSDEEITTGGGFNIADFVELTKSEINQMKLVLVNLIKENAIVEYSVFIDYVRQNLDVNYFDVASSHTVFFNTYIKSMRYAAISVNPITGEVGASPIKND